MSADALLKSSPSGVADTNLRELTCLAARGLVAMYDADRQLFCNRLVRTGGRLVREGLSPRYTIMTLLGLRELELAGGQSPFDTSGIYNSLVRDTSWIRGAGDLGLLLWLTAAVAPDQLGERFRPTDLAMALDRYPDAREGRTMELAWFLAGLAHAALASPGAIPYVKEQAAETYHRLKQNQGKYGLFGHMSTRRSVAGFVRGRIGSFADQIYPIYAMAKFATAFQAKASLESALECTAALCGAQGELGQWWWLYDSRTGRVSSRYPVYSVHQHAMAPMSLFALEEATGQSFKGFIHKGLRWIYGANELHTDMRDFSHDLIWRCILPTAKRTKYWETALSLLRAPRERAPVGALQILLEERPYELGWLLYAFARRARSDN